MQSLLKINVKKIHNVETAFQEPLDESKFAIHLESRSQRWKVGWRDRESSLFEVQRVASSDHNKHQNDGEEKRT